MKTTNQTQCIHNKFNQSPTWVIHLVLILALLTSSAKALTYQWAATNVNCISNWSGAISWVGGGNPGSADSVLIDHRSTGPFTNVVDNATVSTIQDFTIQHVSGMGDDNKSAATGVNTIIAAGQTLSILGPNGFNLTRAGGITNISNPTYFFYGNTMIVSNPSASFMMNDGQLGGASGKWTTVNMSSLTNLFVTVNRFGQANDTLTTFDGAQVIKFTWARTNVVRTVFKSDYSQLDFTNSIEINRQDLQTATTAGANCLSALGISNAFYADSFGLGRGNGGGGTAAPTFGTATTTFGFAVTFATANSATPTSSAFFRNTNGVDPMSLLAIGVDSGVSLTNSRNSGLMNLQGGNVNMLVDQIWLGRNRTNAVGNNDFGGLWFDNGTINANTIIAGYMQYTNSAQCGGLLLVGTNGILVVNTNLTLGYTPTITGITGFEPNVAGSFGQLWITNGGVVCAKKISVGQYSTNNFISVAPFSSLIVSNTIANSSAGLTTLNLNGGSMTFFVTAGVTNAYVTNLLTSSTATKINIASAPVGQSTNVLISFQATNQVPNLTIGNLPGGFNNMSIVIDGAAKTVSLVISTNQPKNLAWRGGQNALWDLVSTNWIDLSLNAPTNVTKYTDGDKVTFDDTVGVPTNITVATSINPSQSGNGILVTNNINKFTFTNNGVATIGVCTLLKAGASSLEIDSATSAGAQVNGGTLILGTGGTIANATTVTGTVFKNSGLVSGGVSCSGTVTNTATGGISGNLAIQTSGFVVNSGTLVGNVSMQSGCSLYNLGTLTSIGNLTIQTNSTVLNSGTIYGAPSSVLTIALGGTLTDNVQGTAGTSPGSINVGTLLVNGTFNPGGSGNSIGTTKVTDYSDASTQQGAPNGRVQLNAGSVTTFKVNTANTQPYTKLLSQSTVYGPSGATKSINGCTLVITNVGASPFAAGQTFKLFGSYYADATPGNAGLNTTNSYPTIVPQTPSAGLVWDLSQLYVSGTIGVIDPATVPITLTNSITTSVIGGTNFIVTELSWSADFIGNGWVQRLDTGLTNGLSATNWQNLAVSDYVNDLFITNTVSSDTASFFRFVRP